MALALSLVLISVSWQAWQALKARVLIQEQWSWVWWKIHALYDRLRAAPIFHAPGLSIRKQEKMALDILAEEVAQVLPEAQFLWSYEPLQHHYRVSLSWKNAFSNQPLRLELNLPVDSGAEDGPS